MTSYNLLGRDVEEVYANRVDRALAEVDDPLYMPDLIRARLSVNSDHRLWQTWWTSPSIRATGRTAAGAAVVLYAHVPNTYSDAENVRAAIDGGKLVNDTEPLSHDEFARLLSLEGSGVFVVDHDYSRNFFSGLDISQALAHPQTIPFLGVSQEEAQLYLQRHEAVYGKSMGICDRDDLGSEPVARVLLLGTSSIDLLGSNYLDSNARVLGVRRGASPVLEKILS